MTAAVWCPEHVPTKSPIHQMHDLVNDLGINALQLYAQNFKQADLSLTWTVRKANLISAVTKIATLPLSAGARRSSTVASPGAAMPSLRLMEGDVSSTLLQPGDKVCITCGIDVSLKWWSIDDQRERDPANGYPGMLGDEAQRFMDQRKFQCHKCRKAHQQPKPLHPPSYSLRTAAGAIAAAGSARQTSHPPSSPLAAAVTPARSASPLQGILNSRLSLSPSVQARPPPPPVLSAAPLQAPVTLAPRQYSSLAPAPNVPPGPGPPVREWRGLTPNHRHVSPPQQLNGPIPLSPSRSPLSLRPPPLGPVAPPMASHHQNGYASQPSQQQPPPPTQRPVSPRYVGGYPPHRRQSSLGNGFPPPPRPVSHSLLPSRYNSFQMAPPRDNYREAGPGWLGGTSCSGSSSAQAG